MMSTYLVTGGAGFIGSHLCERLLATGEYVVAADNFATGSIENLAGVRREKGFRFYRVDIRGADLEHVFQRHQPDFVMHLAAQSGVRPSVEDPLHDGSVNVGGLLNILRCSSDHGVRKIVYASSGGTIYGAPRSLPVREEQRHGSTPLSPYGISKKVGEEYLRFFRDQRGLDYSALALGNVYGPRQDPRGEAGVVAIFGTRLLAGAPPTVFGDGEQTRDYVYVTDVVEAFMRAVDRAPGLLMNVGTGQETSVNEIFVRLAALTGFAGEPAYAPAAPFEVRRISLDASLADRALGWRPTTGLDEGLGWTLEALRRNGEPAHQEHLHVPGSNAAPVSGTNGQS
jgi:UDP-glucose 4-epimerase